MMNLVIFVVIAVVLFGLAFISKRHFGIHGLALVAGATLSSLWGNTAAVLVSSSGVVPVDGQTDAIVLCLVTLFPALLLLSKGKKYHSTGGRVIGSTMFTALALACIVVPLSSILPLDASGVVVYSTLLQYQSLIISVGIVIALLDILVAKTPKHSADDKHRH